MTPVFTFLIAIPFRLEKVDLTSKAGITKVIGTVVCLAGAMLLTFYQGSAITNTSNQLTGPKKHAVHIVEEYDRKKWMLGTIALFAGTFSWSSWFLIQSKVGKKYPALYSGTALIFFLGFLQAAFLTFATQSQRGLTIWALKDKVEIATVIFSGMVGSGFGFLVMSWCVEKRGPVFTAAFSPLAQIFVAVIDVCILHELLYLGSVLGSGLVIAGLYLLLWGKSSDAHCNAVKPSEVTEDIHRSLPTV